MDESYVVLNKVGANRIEVIRVLRETIAGLPITEASALLERTPTTVKEGLSREQAEDVQKKLAEAGATAEVRKYSIPGVDYF
jgi:large subunit ribosomal protein L7/L12